MLTSKQEFFLEKAIELSAGGAKDGFGGPFGCVITRNDEIVGQGFNQVIALNDPTAHAEIMAIRDACRRLSSFQLNDCELFASCEPCPMCLGAIYWARPRLVVYANTRLAAADIGFDDAFIYSQIQCEMENRKIPFIHQPHPLAEKIFGDWKNWKGRKPY